MLNIAEIIALLAVVVYFIQTAVMRQTLVYTNRAYVYMKVFERPEPVRHISSDADPMAISAWRFSPNWENSGNTPTVEMENYINWICFTGLDGIPTEFDFPDIISGNVMQPARLMIGPRNFISAQSFDIGTQFLNEAWRRNCRIYMWGWTEYKDVFWFGRLHRTEFCNEIVVEGDPTKADCRFSMGIAPNHNGSGRQCYRKAGSQARRAQPAQVWPPPHDTSHAP